MEVIDISRNEWCLVRPVGLEEEEEGWVPAGFLKPYSGGGFGKFTCSVCGARDAGDSLPLIDMFLFCPLLIGLSLPG